MLFSHRHIISQRTCQSSFAKPAMTGAIVLWLWIAALGIAFGAAVEKTTKAVTPLYKLEPGEELNYRFRYVCEGNTDIRSLAENKANTEGTQNTSITGGTHSFRTEVRGELALTVLQVKDQAVVSAVRIDSSSIVVRMDGIEHTAQATAVQRELKEPAYLRMTREGTISAIAFESSAGSLTRNFGRAILAVLQFSTPQKPDPIERTWVAEEEDVNGLYSAAYEIVTAPDTNNKQILSIRKAITSYLKPVSQSTTVIQPKGSIVVRFDQGSGCPVSYAGVLSQEILVGENKIGNSRIDLTCRLIAKRQIDNHLVETLLSKWIEHEKSDDTIPLSKPMSAEAQTALTYRSILGESEPESILSGISELSTKTGTSNPDTRLYLKLKALVYLHPEVCTELEKILLVAQSGSAALDIVAGALESVGNESAQAALVATVKARITEPLVLSVLIPALGSVNVPTQSAEDTIRAIAFGSASTDVTTTAKLALGAMAFRLAVTSPERSSKIVEQFLDKLSSTKSAEEKGNYIAALGNTRSERAFSALAALLKDTDPSIRSSVVLSLGHFENEGVDDYLADRLVSDLDANVRSNAATAIGYRSENGRCLEALKQTMTKDDSVITRALALQSLWKVYSVHPEVKELVRRAANEDSSEDVRRIAKAYVDQQ